MRIVFLVNGELGSAMDVRAREFFKRLRSEMEISIFNRGSDKLTSIRLFVEALSRTKPDLCYVFDMAYSGVIAAAIHRLRSGCPVIVDTGDAITDLAKLSGSRGRIGIFLTAMLEKLSYWISSHMVVRSHPHQDLLRSRGIESSVIPDGVDTKQFKPQVDPDLRRELGLEGITTIGLLGSIVWNDRWQMCYGWDLVETLKLMPGQPVKGVVIGDGSGLGQLKRMASDAGVSDRMIFLGRQPYDRLPKLLSLFDICLSTQTDDAAGRVRTTGKLPLYLASGRFVLSSQVGEAARILPPEMLVRYDGTKDLAYPARLSERVSKLMEIRSGDFTPSASLAQLAFDNFDYGILALRLRQTITAISARLHQSS
jgi:glycosyltransferase involved in cell wall biosynthesis